MGFKLVFTFRLTQHIQISFMHKSIIHKIKHIDNKKYSLKGLKSTLRVKNLQRMLENLIEPADQLDLLE